MTDNAILEIVELPSGEVVLRPSHGDDDTPLVSIRFSAQALEMLQRSRFDVAREMIDHAITRTAVWEGDEAADDEGDDSEITLH